MKRNKLVYQFGNVITRKPKRSGFKRSHSHTTTFNVGEIIPVYIDEVLPGDTFKINTKAIARQTTMIKPVMDNCYLDIMYFFVPWRLIWSDLKKFFGENSDPYFVTDKPSMPFIAPPKGGWQEGTIADYMNIPVNVDIPGGVNALPFRAYSLVFNDWFRDENLQGAAHIDLGGSGQVKVGSNGDNFITDLELGGKPAIANKYKDYFTTALPSPQKGMPVTFNLGGQVPVQTSGAATVTGSNKQPLYFTRTDGTEVAQDANLAMTAGSGGAYENTATTVSGFQNPVYPNNLYADLSTAAGVTINELRQAAALQQALECDARVGTRYVEYIFGRFAVDAGDARIQRSEYLGGTHEPLGVQQVPQTNSTDSTSPQANLAAFGQTSINHMSTVDKTFLEHGYIMALAVVRYKHKYQQGLEKLWSRKDRYDIYDPIFANIGEQPIYNKEIFLQNDDTVNNEVFGFQEAFADYRYKIDRVTGKMRSGTDSLDIWHYADNYKVLPKLSSDWIKEDKNNVDRTLAISSDKEPQFIIDMFFDCYTERPMPVYSTPGMTRI